MNILDTLMRGGTYEFTNQKSPSITMTERSLWAWGIKAVWMVVEGTSQKAVMDAFLQGRKTFKNCSVNGELHA